MSKIIKSNAYEIIDGITMYYEDYVKELQQEFEKLQQENQYLKQSSKNKDLRNSRQRVANAKLIKRNKKLKYKLKDEIECKETVQVHRNNLQIIESYQRKEKEKYKNILTEFEKWLEYIKQYPCMFKPNVEYEIVKEIYDKLQELKEGNK